ncbi:unnamed protein product [Durusdinium trenchii]|uniref:Uncharacterized protein n=1 Tax=Durusdinium trenchii TaxID=1381693 RepID=A0ABP0NT16_9DINO
MRIDPFLVAAGGGSSALELFGDVGTTGYKWLHGVMSQTSSIYAVPAGASTVLVIDTASLNVSELAIGATLPASFENFVHSVLSPQGDIFGIPADSTFVLWIRPSTQVLKSIFWIRRVHVLRAAASQVLWRLVTGRNNEISDLGGKNIIVILRIDPATDPPTLDETLGDGLFDATTQKWSAAILGPDGRIFGVPHGASQVLLIDPALSSVFLVGPVWGGGLYKWQGGILAIDHSIYMMPYDNERVLRVIPNSTGADVVEEVLDGFTLPGEQKYSGVAMVPSGALFAFPAYAAEVLSMVPAVDLCLAGPQFQESVCTLGQSCTVELTPTPDWPTNLSNGILWVSPAGSLCQEQLNLEVIGFTNPQTEPTQTGQGEQVTHSFGTGLSGNVSTQSLLCWKFHASSLDIIELGQFQLLGPYQNHQVICNLGEPCLVILNGVGLDNSSWVLAAAANGSCNVSNETLADFQGFANPVKYDGSPGESASFGLGEAINGTAGSYEICWSSSTLTSPSLDLFVTHVGSLVVNGPFLATSIDLSCWVQFECSLVVAGVGLSAQNQLTIGQLDCNSTMQLAMIDGFSNPVTSTNGTTYVIGAALAAYRDRLVLCWHATSTATGIPLGTLMVYGPVNGGLHITCRLNDTCSISLANETIIGYIDDGFSLQNRLQLEKQDSCTGIPASLWGNLSQPVVPSATLVANFSSLFFDLFAPTANNVTAADEVLGAYSLCLSLGDGPFAMKLGLLLIEDVFCAAPEGIVQALEPACLSSTTGLSASSLRHGESCITQCDAESTESLNSLDCVYGELQPASFECFRSCTTAPVVNNGLSHESCAGLLHGAVCDLQCAANTVASGYLLCNFGFFIHKIQMRCEIVVKAQLTNEAAYALLPHAESELPRWNTGPSQLPA